MSLLTPHNGNLSVLHGIPSALFDALFSRKILFAPLMVISSSSSTVNDTVPTEVGQLSPVG